MPRVRRTLARYFDNDRESAVGLSVIVTVERRHQTAERTAADLGNSLSYIV